MHCRPLAIALLLGFVVACKGSEPVGSDPEPQPPENAAPTAVDDAVTTDEDVPVSFDPRANDSDPDGDPLTVATVSAPEHGSATVEGGVAVTYTPGQDFNGTDAFTYTVADGNGATATATVTVTVTRVNDSPVAVDDAVTTQEDEPVSFDPRQNDSDVDGDPLTIVQVGDPEHGVVTIESQGGLHYVPDSGFHGEDAFEYTVADPSGASATATVTVTVLAVNEEPQAVDDAVTTAVDTPITFDPRANDSDADGDPLTITNIGDPSNGTATINAGESVTYTPDQGFAGTDAFAYTVSDGQGGAASATITVTVEQTLAITISLPSDPYEVGAEVSLVPTVTGPGPHQFTSVGSPLPPGLTLDASTGQLSGTLAVEALLGGSPGGVWSGLVLRVTDGTAAAETAPFTLTLTGTSLPMPYAYMAFDGDLNDAFGAVGTPIGSVSTGQQGAIDGAVRVSGSESRIRYPTSLSSTLNGKGGFTYATTIRTSSASSMFFNLANSSSGWARAYAELSGGRVAFGGRSRTHSQESWRQVVGSTSVADGQFHSVVGVLSLGAGRIDLYVDGRLDASGTPGFTSSTFETITPANQSVVGHISGVADTSVAPDVTHDEMALWDVSLNAYQAATVAWLIRRGTSLRSWIGF